VEASNPDTVDRNGATVAVGSVVRVLDIPESLLAKLSSDEAARVKSMKGAVLSVYEIDEWGSAWVEKWWSVGEEDPRSHSLALGPSEMEVVSSGSDSDA
jgi:hypothetical protein